VCILVDMATKGNAMTITLTEGDKVLTVTTWDRFYQAALRAGVITDPIDELDAVNMAQGIARDNGFELYEVPATPKSWFAGKGVRKSVNVWFEYVRAMGMTVKS
jgi:hypothetical protein